MSRRQPPVIRAGSGDTHDARVAVLEKRFSDDMQARCSWCNQISGASRGQWIEVFLSTPGSGIAPAHVFRCETCEASTSQSVGTAVLMVPRRAAKWSSPSSAPASRRVNSPSGAREPTPSLAPIGTSPKPRAVQKPKPAASGAKAAGKAARKRSPKVAGNPAVAPG